MKLFRTFALSTALGMTLTPAFADVTLRYLASQGGLSAYELAAELGHFDGTGITLENLGYAQCGPASLVALAGGSVEIGSAATAAVLNSIAAGNDFVAAFPSNGINDEAQSIFYVLEDSPIKSIEDIPGKTIAVNTLGAHLDYVVREALHQKGLPEDSASLIVVPGPQLEQVLRAVFDDTDVLGDIAGGFIVLRRDWIETHPEEAKAFVEGSVKALDYARENPDETKAIFAKVLAERGENADVAQYFAGYGVREGGLPVERHPILDRRPRTSGRDTEGQACCQRHPLYNGRCPGHQLRR